MLYRSGSTVLYPMVAVPDSDPWRAWEQALGGHPDTMFREYIARGIRESFRLGFDYSHHCVPATKNMPSTKAYPQPVQANIDKECQTRRILGPLPREAMQKSRFGVIPSQSRH